jgi:hypothetical protein
MLFQEGEISLVLWTDTKLTVFLEGNSVILFPRVCFVSCLRVAARSCGLSGLGRFLEFGVSFMFTNDSIVVSELRLGWEQVIKDVITESMNVRS